MNERIGSAPSPSEFSPQEFDARFEQALALQHAGNLDAAAQLYTLLLQQDPHNAAVLVNLAGIHSARGAFEKALTLLEQAVAAQPREAYAYLAYGNILVKMQRYAEAVPRYEQAIALQPNIAQFHTSLGVVFYYMARPQGALACHDRALALQPGYADAHNNRGNALASLKRKQEALESYERACALGPHNPLFWCNRGAMLYFFRRYEEALASYDRALALQPDYPDALINRGTLLGDTGRIEEALAAFDRALALQPDATEAQWNKALHLLRQGNFAEGWRLYESRWKKSDFQAAMRNYPQPLWLGETDISGKTILIHPEQGFGDTIQFSRFMASLESLGAKVILEAQAPLVPLLKTLEGTVTIVAKDDPLPPFDLHCPIMSLPLALKSRPETIPNRIPYLSADQTRRTQWTRQLGPKTQPRIGIAWSGSAVHVNDHNRSMPLEQWSPLWALPYEFHALQKDIRAEDQLHLQHLQSHAPDLHDFADTAALIEAMDLVICVDTSVAHLAGALGKPVWLLLPYVPDYRWLMDRPDTPWYPTMRLFRQTSPGDWSTIITQVMQALMEHPNAQQTPSDQESQETVEQAFTQALTSHQSGDLGTAQEIYQLILEIRPQHVQALSNLSSLHLARGNYEDALLLIERALAIDPNLAPLHYNYGKILMHVKMPAEALIQFDRAIALQPQTASFHSNRGIALFELTRYDDAIASYDRAVALEPDGAEYYNNRGNAMGHVTRFEEALADYTRAVALAPEMADAHWNRSLLQLMHGDFEAGLRSYEWRWKKESFARDLRRLEKPLWLGDAPIAGRTIFIYPEQGLGDIIQFSRYVPLLEALGAKVILEVPASLVKLLSTLSPTVQVIAKGTVPPSYDFQCPVMSLPLAFETTLATIPSHMPYLAVDAEKRVLWQQRLGPKTHPRIGIAWSGSATHVNDHNRSIPLALLASLWSQPFEFHSLQKEVRASDQPYLSALKSHQEMLQDFTDTAALIEAMDLVICVDTSVAHLAGALNKPVWLLLPAIPDYRWLLKRDDTPWYPTMRLFRQTNGWPDVIARVAASLEAFKN